MKDSDKRKIRIKSTPFKKNVFNMKRIFSVNDNSNSFKDALNTFIKDLSKSKEELIEILKGTFPMDKEMFSEETIKRINQINLGITHFIFEFDKMINIFGTLINGISSFIKDGNHFIKIDTLTDFKGLKSHKFSIEDTKIIFKEYNDGELFHLLFKGISEKEDHEEWIKQINNIMLAYERFENVTNVILNHEWFPKEIQFENRSQHIMTTVYETFQMLIGKFNKIHEEYVHLIEDLYKSWRDWDTFYMDIEQDISIMRVIILRELNKTIGKYRNLGLIKDEIDKKEIKLQKRLDLSFHITLSRMIYMDYPNKIDICFRINEGFDII